MIEKNHEFYGQDFVKKGKNNKISNEKQAD